MGGRVGRLSCSPEEAELRARLRVGDAKGVQLGAVLAGHGFGEEGHAEAADREGGNGVGRARSEGDVRPEAAAGAGVVEGGADAGAAGEADEGGSSSAAREMDFLPARG
ncbi:uncharacterized protein CMC5_049370 [Chondromyces crocatus]|uniref:Uncharacterized protein n=1 Tax=Chondromyces crocatus TaxID=52 RepID=A0A0K1EIT5_CHOCO|nr:hypothetical protein [Chondromyces crocatus]AKT40781.1 uncharacterized protein CMC5_049370 [Chondromyces crocatus]